MANAPIPQQHRLHRTQGVMCGHGDPFKLPITQQYQLMGSHAQANLNKLREKKENAQPPQQQPASQENRRPLPSKLDRQPGTTCGLDGPVKSPLPQKEPMGDPTPINSQEQMANALPPQQQLSPQENRTPPTTEADGKCTTPSATATSPGKQNTTNITDRQPGTTCDLDGPVELPPPQKEPVGGATPTNPNQPQEKMANAPPPQQQPPFKENRTPPTTGTDGKCAISLATATSQITTDITDRQSETTCDLDGPVMLPLPQKESVGGPTPTNPNKLQEQMANAPPPQQQLPPKENKTPSIIGADGKCKMTEIKAGFLTKCGGKVKNWKKRWVILRSNGFLSYYEKKGGNEKGSIDVINSGRIGYASSIESSEALPSGTDATAAFSIVTKHRTYTFCSDSAAECKDWIACLTRVKSNDSGGEAYQGYPTPTNPNQPPAQMANAPPPQQQPPPAQPQAPPIPPKDQPPAYPYPVGAYNAPAQMPQPQQQPVGGPPMLQPPTQPPPYQPAPQGYRAPPPTQAYRQPTAPYGYNQPGYYRQPYQQPYQQGYRQPYPQPYWQHYQQPYQQQYQTKQPYYPQQRPVYRPPARPMQQQASKTTVVAGGMVITIGNNQQQGAGGQQSASNVTVKHI